MLVLSRKIDEVICIGDDIKITVVGFRDAGPAGTKVRLGIDAPDDVTIHRKEVYEAIQDQRRAAEAEAAP
jgi:carbon storage regulator